MLHDVTVLRFLKQQSASDIDVNGFPRLACCTYIRLILFFFFSRISQIHIFSHYEVPDCVKTNGKGKAFPLQAWTGPEGSRRLRLPDFMLIGTWRWQGCQPYAPAAFTPRKYSWYSFLLESESTPGPSCDRKDYVNEKIRHHRESNSGSLLNVAVIRIQKLYT
jgi:hypothetical protein